MIAPRSDYGDATSHDLGCGRLDLVGAGELARVYTYRQLARGPRHVENKPFPWECAIVTVAGRWTFDGRVSGLEVEPGIVVLGNQGTEFGCRHNEGDEPDNDIVINLNPVSVREALANTPFATDDGPIFTRAFVPRSRAIDALSRSMLLESQRQVPGYELKLDAMALQFLVEVLRFAPSRRRARPDAGANARERIEAARVYLHEHLAEGCSLAELARVAEMSPFYFHRLFAAQVGQSPHRYLRTLRLERAKQLLLHTTMSSTEICYAAGFGSLPHFINTFRDHVGATPSRFRAAAHGARPDARFL